MKCTQELRDGVLVAIVSERLDGYSAKELQAALDRSLLHPALQFAVLDLSAVNYLSSAGLRVFLVSHRRLAQKGGSLVLVGLQEYCAGVMRMAGFGEAWPTFDTVTAALAYCHSRTGGAVDGIALEKATTPTGDFSFRPWSEDSGAVLVLGHIEDVLYSRVTIEHISSKRFSETEFSIGLGGLGSRSEDYLPILGEMMTIGGTMVWLPTDGHDTPDYLIPKTDTGEVTIRTGFNVAQAGDFNEMAIFQSPHAGGATISEIYRALFDLANQRRPDFRGGLSIAMRAEMTAVYGSGVRTSPVASNRPANGRMITPPDHFAAWFEIDREPRHQNVTGLLTGIGIDLTADYSRYDREIFSAAFYVNPANPSNAGQMLHNHAVFFRPLPFPERPADLHREIRSVIERGDFLDMRHLLDGSKVSRALIGISYTREFRRDPAGYAGHV